MGVLFLLVVILVFLVIFEIRYKKRNYHGISSKLPTVYGLPFLGILYQCFPVRKFLLTLHEYFENLKCSTYFTWFGTEPIIVTADPDVIKAVLLSGDCLDKAQKFYHGLDNALPNCLVTSPTHKWRHNRKLMNQVFSNKILNSFFPIFNRESKDMLKQFDNLVDRGEQDLRDQLVAVIIKISFQTTMGENAFPDTEELVENFNYLMEKIANATLLSTVNLSFITRTFKYYRTIRHFKNRIRELVGQKLMENVSDFEQSKEEENIKNSIFIDQAIHFYKNGLFDMDDVVTESIIMITASFETTATTIFSTLVMLAMHPEVQEKLFEEVKSVYHDNDFDVEFDDLKRLPFLDMVVDETLRLMPSVPLIARQTTNEIILKENISIPKGVQLGISMFSLHRKKELWGPNANAFDPDHFLPENVAKRHPYAYIPFSKGQRNCVGLRYAYISVRVLLVGLVRNFKFSTTMKFEDLVLVEGISFTFDVEPKLKLERRD